VTSRGFDFGSPREIAPLTHEPTARDGDGCICEELATGIAPRRPGVPAGAIRAARGYRLYGQKLGKFLRSATFHCGLTARRAVASVEA
jgi:hypothetical protein